MLKKKDIKKLYEIMYKANQDSIAWSLNVFMEDPKPKILSFLNAHAINNAYRDNDFSCNLMKSDYLLRDGIGIHIAFKLLKFENTENLNGTDLIPKILQYDRAKKIAIYGTSDEVLLILKNKLIKEGHSEIVSTLHGFYENQTYIDDAKDKDVDIIILCMGMPKQEILSVDLGSISPTVICAGGWADFYSGKKNRAPKWVQDINMEWFHRLLSEPKRLGKRYTIDVIFYFILVAKIVTIKKNME